MLPTRSHSPGDAIRLLQAPTTDTPDPMDIPEAMHSTSNPAIIPSQVHENDEALVVLVSEPEAASISMGGLHPRASLYERPVDLDASITQHATFRSVLRSYGIKVLTVRGILEVGADQFMNARVELEDLAMEALTYTLYSHLKIEDLSERDQYAMSDAYKRSVLEKMSIGQLIDIVMVNPTVELSPTERDTGLEAKYQYSPLSNLIYTRDQQITTTKGIVMGRLQSTQRKKEVDLLAFCFRKIGMTVLGRIESPGYLEGGDFYPAGMDLCFIGIGLRSNIEACYQLMDNDWLGTQSVAVVKDLHDQSQDRMHLDCVFNIIGYDSCLLLEDITTPDSPKQRMVDLYVKESGTGRYHIQQSNIEFGTFLKQRGFKIVPIKTGDQVEYACNALNVGHGRLITVHAASSREIVRSPHFDGSVEAIEFSSITSMYGAVHCSTQVLKRRGRKTEAIDIS